MSRELTFGSLFAGIGGIDLGLERAGWTGRWQVEWDDWCQRVLAKHWPDVPRVGDIRDAHAAASCTVPDSDSIVWGTEQVGVSGSGHKTDSRDDGSARFVARCPNCLPYVDLIAGGFPCQPFSVAGKRLGKEDDRWLWPEFARVVGELRPRYVLVENVPGLLAGHGGMGSVLGDLADLGYDAEWDSVPAAAVGAPHLRYRVWIVAHLSDAARLRGRRAWERTEHGASSQGGTDESRSDGTALAHPDSEGSQGHGGLGVFGSGAGEWLARARSRAIDARREPEPGLGRSLDGLSSGLDGAWGPGWEDGLPRVAQGVPDRVNRLRGLGNAVVPQVVEAIGRRLLDIASD